jgi:hypothetical protein
MDPICAGMKVTPESAAPQLEPDLARRRKESIRQDQTNHDAH